jgi:hypothetical protein
LPRQIAVAISPLSPKQAISMAEKKNLLSLLPYLTKKELQDLELCGVHPLWERQRAIKTLFEASTEYRAAYATIARKLLRAAAVI